MESDADAILQQPIRKRVGRSRTAMETLAHLEDLTEFLKTHVPGTSKKREGDYFPVRKTVGRPPAPPKLPESKL